MRRCDYISGLAVNRVGRDVVYFAEMDEREGSVRWPLEEREREASRLP